MTLARVSVRIARLVLAMSIIAVTLVGLGLGARPTWALSAGESGFSRIDISVVFDADGVARLTYDMDFDFGDEPGRGPTWSVMTKQNDKDGRVRLYPVSGISVSSPSGAPAKLYTDDADGYLTVRIGDQNIDDVTGNQRYILSFTQKGLINPSTTTGGLDEFYQPILNSVMEIPAEKVTVRVSGPAPVAKTICYQGSDNVNDPCTSHRVEDGKAVFTQNRNDVGEQFSIDAGFPAGTFPGYQPIIVDASDADSQDYSEPLITPGEAAGFGVAGAAVLAGGLGVVGLKLRRNGRDLQYTGVTPGLTPDGAQPTQVEYRKKNTPVAVQFNPPPGVLPGEVGTLSDEKADPEDVTATIVDLAVRGYIRIEETTPAHKRHPAGMAGMMTGSSEAQDWNLTLLRDDTTGLRDYEIRLLTYLFTGHGSQVKISELSESFADSMRAVQDLLYQDVTDRNWFRGNPKLVRNTWSGVGLLLILLGFAVATMVPIVFGAFGIAFIGGAVGIVGIVTLIGAKAAPARTADGSAVLNQVLGFRQYIATAEAGQLKLEEGEDIFSKYLPYAIVFGLANRWTKIFTDLAAAGQWTMEPTWYVGPSYGMGSFWRSGLAFSYALNNFNHVATTALTSIPAPTAGSLGGSGFGGGGFSGGGGFAGGGAGGGGGGRW